MDDATWVALVRRGDEGAACALVQRLYPTILRSVRQHRPRRTSEEDLVQTVLVKVFRKLDQFSGLVLLEHWVSRITVNTCINQLKHETARPELRMGDLTEDEEAVVLRLASTEDTDGPPGERQMAARELLEILLARLPSDQQRVIRLLHLDELSVETISRQTGWSVSLVKVKAFRARRKMRHIWHSLFKGQKL